MLGTQPKKPFQKKKKTPNTVPERPKGGKKNQSPIRAELQGVTYWSGKKKTKRGGGQRKKKNHFLKSVKEKKGEKSKKRKPLNCKCVRTPKKKKNFPDDALERDD